MAVASKRRLDTFDQWCLRYMLHTAHVTNKEVRSRTGQPPVTSLVKSRPLKLFGHLLEQNRLKTMHAHCELPSAVSPRIGAAQEVVRRLPHDWKQPLGRPSHTWLRAVEADLGQQNIGLAAAWRKEVSYS